MGKAKASFATSSGFAGWLIVIIPLFLGLLATNKGKNKNLRGFLLILIILLTICLILTYSRGAWLGFAIGISLMIWNVFKNLALKIKMLCLFVSVGLLAIYLVLPQPIKTKISAIGRIDFKYSYQTVNARIKSTLKIDQGSTPIRLNLWKESLSIIRDYPLVGCGLNTYSTVARGYKSFEGGGVYPHNSYLQMAAETGLFGLTAFLWVLFTFFKVGMHYLNQSRNFLVLGLLSGILAFMVHAFFDTHLYSLQLVVLFWYMLGLTVAVIKIEEKNETISYNTRA